MANRMVAAVKANPGKSAGGISAAAAAVALSLIQPWEGRRNDPYLDIVKVWTVCDGETNVTMRRYSNAECDAMTIARINKDYGPSVVACVPGLRDRPQQLGASISLSYNIGSSAFCRSTAAKRFRAGDWIGGCNAFLAWNRAGGKVVRGLQRRREAERAVCLKGLPL